MEEELRSNLVLLTERFADATGLKASTVLARAANDARFLDRTAGGKTFTIRVYDNALVWFADNWPPNANWPDAIPKPEPAASREPTTEIAS